MLCITLMIAQQLIGYITVVLYRTLLFVLVTLVLLVLHATLGPRRAFQIHLVHHIGIKLLFVVLTAVVFVFLLFFHKIEGIHHLLL